VYPKPQLQTGPNGKPHPYIIHADTVSVVVRNIVRNAMIIRASDINLIKCFSQFTPCTIKIIGYL
jgi:hypothetical protein